MLIAIEKLKKMRGLFEQSSARHRQEFSAYYERQNFDQPSMFQNNLASQLDNPITHKISIGRHISRRFGSYV